MPPRTFEDRPATREKTPVLVGLIGPSGSGKTFSALRLAEGFQRVSGGETFFIDTEARRALHYADRFKFRHVAFGAPFSPLDYLEAINHCLSKGATTIVIDSMSHEHEGPGGVLEEHEAELDRMAGNDWEKRKRMTMIAWAKPKAKRRRLINSILQMQCNFIFCFRAKKKLKIVRGQEPEELGFQPIAGEEFIYEMTLKALLLPGANGVPAWTSTYEGEKAMMKLPEQFRATFAKNPQLTEDIGEQLARWGAGGAQPKAVTAEEMKASYAACSDPATLRALEDTRGAVWSKLSKDEKLAVKAAAALAEERVKKASEAPPAEQPFSLSSPTPEELAIIAERERKEADTP